MSKAEDIHVLVFGEEKNGEIKNIILAEKSASTIDTTADFTQMLRLLNKKAYDCIFFLFDGDIAEHQVTELKSYFPDIEDVYNKYLKDSNFQQDDFDLAQLYIVIKPGDSADVRKTKIHDAFIKAAIIKANKSIIESVTSRSLEKIDTFAQGKGSEEENLLISLKEEVRIKQDKINQQSEELKNYKFRLLQMVEEKTVDLMQAKEKAEESDRLKSAFLANLSHEIRTPLHAIVGFSELIINPDVPDEDKEEFIGQITVNNKYLLDLVEDIIEISQIEAGQITLHFSTCNLKEILHEMLKKYTSWKKKMDKDNIDISISDDCKERNYFIRTDISKLRQILTNLLENALKFTEKGEIEIGFKELIQEEKPFVQIHIKDTGFGLDLDEQNLIFDRFVKLDKNPARLMRGTGLGLAISKSLIELLGGEIWLESSPGTGSVFYFTLPSTKTDLSIPEKEIPSPKEKEKVDWSSKLVLIAEDEIANFKVLESGLKITGVNLLWAKNGKEVVQLYENNKDIDLILMDIRMPEMNGMQAISKIRQMDTQVPVIAQTAYALPEDKNDIISSGYDAYLAKPFSIEDLIRVMKKFI